MEVFAKQLMDKISQYNILTNIIPGSVLCMILKYLTDYDLLTESVYYNIVIIYFVGVVNSRVSSLIETILRRTKIIVFKPYKDFISAEKKDPKISVLNQENNVFRSYISVMLISIVAYIYEWKSSLFDCIQEYEKPILILFLFVIFSFSYYKQTDYIKKRIEKANEINNESE